MRTLKHTAGISSCRNDQDKVTAQAHFAPGVFECGFPGQWRQPGFCSPALTTACCGEAVMLTNQFQTITDTETCI